MFSELLTMLLANNSDLVPLVLIKAGVALHKHAYLKLIEASQVDAEAAEIPAQVRACFERAAVKLDLPRIKSLDEALSVIDTASSLLHLCLDHGNSACLHWLMNFLPPDRGTLLSKDEQGNTLLHTVCRNGAITLDILQEMLTLLQQQFDSEHEFKAFINLPNNDGITALDYCSARKREHFSHHISQFADKVGHLIQVEAELIEGFDLQAQIDEEGTDLNWRMR